MAQFADVILPLPLEGTFTYTLPPQMQDKAKVGCRVIVPFGARKFYSALIVALHDVKPSYTTKQVQELLDESPLVLPQQLDLWRWIADYYLCTLGDVYKAALPSGLKLESESRIMYVDDYESDVQFTPSESKVLKVMQDNPTIKLTELQSKTNIGNILPVIKSLLEKGVVRMSEEVKRTYKAKTITCVRLTERCFDELAMSAQYPDLKRTPRQQQLLALYAEKAALNAAVALRNYSLLREVPKQELMEGTAFTPAIFNGLRDKGILETYQKPITRLVQSALPQQMVMHPLSEIQERARQEILAGWQQHDVCLLHGVTGSGKTEVYIHLMQQALEQGRQVLFMLPEIVLTTQLTDRLKRVFGDRLGVYHSRYPDAERVEVYQKMLSSEPYDIIVGVRSSIFLPFQRLGLLIIDEEHETSFKQTEPAPRYHARNVALVMAAKSRAKTLLGTATPSLESYYNAQRGKYAMVELMSRHGDVQLPKIEVVDMREMRRKKMMCGPFTPQLVTLVREALKRRQQVILFQNRRGYAPMMECHVCGWVPRCTKCDVSLTLHRNMRQMTCHYCGASYPIPLSCPNCQERQINSHGYGTERIEDEVRRIFPEARVARMDLDTTRSRQSYEQIIQDFEHGRTDILIGTQMVTKGLDFEHVSVVGILNADTMLSQPDFRSYERAFQMMVQVAGRAGRKQEQGHVILQTRDVEAPVIGQVMQQNYKAMFCEQMEERELFNYPPYCRLISVYMKHRDERVVESLALELANYARQVFGGRVLGPDTPPIGRVQMMYIRKVLLKIELNASMADARQRLRQLQQYLLSQPKYKSAQLYYDVD